MKKILIISTLALCTVAFADEPAAPAATPAPAPVAERPQPPPPPPMRHGMMRRGGMGMNHSEISIDRAIIAAVNPRNAERIGISSEQADKIKTAEREFHQAMREGQKNVRTATDKQFQLMKEDPVNEEAVLAAIDELFDARKNIAKLQFKRSANIRKILTPEQLAKAVEITAERFANRRQKAAPAPEVEATPAPEAPEAPAE